MAKETISDAEFDELEQNKRLGDIVRELRAIAKNANSAPNNDGLKDLLMVQTSLLEQIVKKDNSERLVSELKPLIESLNANLKELKSALTQKSHLSWRLQRGENGLLERVVAEKPQGN